MSRFDVQTLEKQPGESRLYAFDFSADMAAAETISTVNAVAVTPASPALTAGSPSIVGKTVEIRLSGGTTGNTYTVSVRVTTSASNILEMEGRLLVRERP